MSDALIQFAQVVLPCAELDPTLEFFTDHLGFRVDAIYPADEPRTAVISGHGVRVQLDARADGPPGVLRLLSSDPARLGNGETELTAPNGTRIELADADPPVVVPPVESSVVVNRNEAASWGTGRAGMRYRDLIPGRLGGAFIASHIQIPGEGPVPDYVHFHKIRFQMIYCYRGWARLVYEDQGPPFVLNAGDCVLQPPRIRHRVLESGGGMEVVEIGAPAEHETFADHELGLPTPMVKPMREFEGQRFVRHEAGVATWRPWRIEGFEYRDTGIGGATDGLAGARVARRTGTPASERLSHDAQFLFHFVLEGRVTLRIDGRGAEALGPGDTIVIPAGVGYAFDDTSSDLQLLDVTMPADFTTSKPP